MPTRTFIAIELSAEIRTALTQRILDLQRTLPGSNAIRWVEPTNLHLTLAFLGDLDNTELASASEAAFLAGRACEPFSLRLGELGTFGPRHAPRVIWLGVAGDMAALGALQDTLKQQLAERGLPASEHPFSPHLTLARLQLPVPEQTTRHLSLLLVAQSQTQTASNAPAFLVDHIAVMKSELLQPASRYTRLQLCPLGR